MALRPSNTQISCERRRPLPLEDARTEGQREALDRCAQPARGLAANASALVSCVWLLVRRSNALDIQLCLGEKISRSLAALKVPPKTVLCTRAAARKLLRDTFPQ